MQEKKLIIFIDSGDTLVDESTEYRREGSEVVERALLIPGAKQALLALKEKGFVMEMVADGLTASFDNVYRQNGLEDIFTERTISEEVGAEKPAAEMFRTAMEKLGLGEADKGRIIMVGNNLKKDIAGANRFGITSVLMAWSPRYCMVPENEEQTPDHVIRNPLQLVELAERLEREQKEHMPHIMIEPYREQYWQELCAIHDAARKMELAHACLDDAFLPLEIAAEREGLLDYAHIDIALLDCCVAGFCAYSDEELAWLYVLPQFMRKGIGSALVSYALETEPHLNYVEVLFGNEPARGLYESFGFRTKEIISGVMPGNEVFHVRVYAMYRES